MSVAKDVGRIYEAIRLAVIDGLRVIRDWEAEGRYFLSETRFPVVSYEENGLPRFSEAGTLDGDSPTDYGYPYSWLAKPRAEHPSSWDDAWSLICQIPRTREFFGVDRAKAVAGEPESWIPRRLFDYHVEMLVNHYIHSTGLKHFRKSKFKPLFVQWISSVYPERLSVRFLVPILLIDFDVDEEEPVSENVRLIRMSHDLQLARAPRQYTAVSASTTVLGAATHAVSFEAWELPNEMLLRRDSLPGNMDALEDVERRLEAMDGKAMIVCMSRRICMDLHDEIVALRPEWFHADNDKGMLKVVMTGNASEGPQVAFHARNKARREALAQRFRDPADPFKIVIVRDMWLTGFDAPSLHTMYIDKPMRGHGLMQTIARVNRVFRDKPGGLVVDYLGIADDLRSALATYTESGGTGTTAISQEQAVAIMQEKYEICLGLFHGFDWTLWTTGTATERLSVLPAAQEHILAQEDGKKRLLSAVTELSQAFALAVPHERALAIRDDVGFFQAVRGALAKQGVGAGPSREDLEHAIRQIISRAVATDEVVDVFAAAGLRKPDISILSEEFLADVRSMPQRNLAVELLRTLLAGEIKTRERRNVVQARSFAELLEKAILKYQNRAIETAQVIEELIAIAREMREAQARGHELGLTDDELAFYDALAANESAVRELGDETLKAIAHELTEQVRNSATIDWAVRESVRAKMRVMVRRLLRKYKYPPDQQEAAVELVIEQAEVLTGGWVE